MKLYLSKFSNKQKGIFVIVFILAICSSLFLVSKIKKQNQIPVKTAQIEYKNPKAESDQDYSEWKIYENKRYGYSIKYPETWKMFVDEEETDFLDVSLAENQTARQGGVVFWSNKDNINYTEESKPDDFHLLGLLIYEKPDTDLNQYANLLGFSAETGTQSIPFEADNLVGKEFFSVGAIENEPRSAVIFKEEDRFFVFHLGFIGDDAQTLKTMEEIVGSFHIEE